MNQEFSPKKTGWIILLDNSRIYINAIWNTKEDAIFWLKDMLKPYSKDSIWREKLTVSFWPLKEK